MANDKVKLQVKMGESTGLDTVLNEPGQILFTTDDGLLHIDTINNQGRKLVNAKNDHLGQEIASTYVKSVQANGKTITVTYGDNDTDTFNTQDTTYTAGDGLGLTGTTLSVKTGAGLTIADDKVLLASISGLSANTYGANSAGVVNHGNSFKVPKVTVDTYGRVTSVQDVSITLPSDNDTKYTAGSGLTASGTTFNVGAGTGIKVTDDAVALDTVTGLTAATYGETTTSTPAHGGKFKIPQITVDTYGRVTAASDFEITLPADNNTKYTAGSGLTASGTTFNVGAGTGIAVTDDAVSLATVSGLSAATYGANSAGTVNHKGTFKVPQVTVDAYGRVTGISDISLTLPADNDTKYSAGEGLALTGTSFSVNAGTGIDVSSDKVNLATVPGLTAATYGSTTAQSPAYKGSFKVPSVTVDAYGRVVEASEVNVTLPAITASDLGLANALHFLGITESTITDGGTNNVTINSVTYVSGTPGTGQKKLTAGDVVLQKNTSKEYIWGGSAWEELGDESSYVVKGFTTVSGDGTVLTGSGKVGEDTTITISHKTTGTAAKTLSAQNVTQAADGSYTFKIPNIAVDAYGHVKYSADSTITINTVAWGSF